MAKISKKKKEEILKTRFPEFYKLATEMEDALDCVRWKVEDILEKIDDAESAIEEAKERKTEVENIDL